MSKIALSPSSSGTGTLTIAAPNTSTDRTLTLPDATGTVQVSGNPISGTTGTFSGTISGGSTIGVGGATPAASGAGITFPASQSASTDANTLDDYEEGTWTPAFTASGASFTLGAQYGAYVKIGAYVYAQFYLRATAYSGSNSNVQITGLPFSSASLNGAFQQPAALWSTTSIAAIPLIGNNSTAADMWKQGTSVTIFTASEIINAYFVGAFVYRAA